VTTLAEAQYQRCDYICRKLVLRPGDRLVEVGSGWGGMAMLAAAK
jgi:cyclopropane-fatty-acyl-phospholipid synthase